MRIRFLFFSLFVLFISCDKISFLSPSEKTLDTIIDYSSVDLSPAFAKCKFLEKEARTVCFETELQQRVQIEIKKHTFLVHEDFNETIELLVSIDKRGSIRLNTVKSSEKIKENFPKLDSVLKASINKLPQVSPAMKQNIPVAIQYKMPVKIKN